MDNAEAKERVNRCVKFANLNLTKYAPMIDQLTPRAKGTVLAAWYDLYAYGEEADVNRLPSAVRPVYLAMSADVQRARSGAAKKGVDDRPDTRPTRCSKPRDSGISSGAATESATNSTNIQQAAETFRSLADVVCDVRSSQFKYKEKDKKERKEKGGNVNHSCYEVGQSYFYAPCPVCGKQAVARFDESGAAYTTDPCGQNGIELPDGCEARSGPDGYTLERTNDPRGDGEHG